MFKRFLFCLPIIASLTSALAQQPPVFSPGPGIPIGPVIPIGPIVDVPKPNPPCDCCAAKPRYAAPGWAPFTGTVAVVTQQRRTDPGPMPSQVVVIWDLHIKSGAPLNTWWNTPGSSPQSNPPTSYYSDPSWNVGNLGDVFGATLDGSGNIYVAASRIYGSANVGALASGTAAQKAGQIYKIANGTGAPTPFVQLPNDGNGLGNIFYDCEFNSLYATNFFDGLIYRMNAAGVIQTIKWNHGVNLPSATDAAGNPLNRAAITGKDGSSSFAALGSRVWGVAVKNNRLYYSTVGNYINRSTGIPNEIYSVALDVNGDPVAPARLEIALPPFATNVSSPVSDITFGPMGTMMVAERMITGNASSFGHSARALEYSFNGTAWVLANPTAYKVGIYGTQTNSAGGVAYDISPGGRVWVTGDAIHLGGIDNIYGLQGFRPGGGDVTNSILIDADDYVQQQNKTQIGVVRIPCPDCGNPPAPPVVAGPRSTCVSPSQYSVTPQTGVTYTWAVTGGTPSATSGSAITVNWSGGPGTVLVTANGPNTCGAVSTFVNVAACSTTCEFCSQFKTNVTLANPVNLGGGLQSITPTVTSTMTGVLGITTTLLNTTVGYSPASCGVAGPLSSYIPQALNSTVGTLNPPLLPGPNGNQAIWRSSTAVNLSTSGATTPFQLKLPPPPVLSPACSANFSLCLRVSLATANCQNCDQMQCFGPFAYSTGLIIDNTNVGNLGNIGKDLIDDSLAKLVPFVMPDGTTLMAPEGSIQIPAAPAR
jgi:hypothetical protein